MTDLYFAAPEWSDAFYAVLALLAALIWLERRRSGSLDRFVSPALRERMVQERPRWRRRLRLVFLSLSCVFLVFALMRPQWGMRTVSAPTFGAEIMICVDVSKSMLAEDVAPNRLERAKAEITDLLNYLKGNQVGIIAFAGRASVLSPLTPDFSFLRLVIDGMGVNTVTRGGTRLEEPIRKAVAGFGEAGEAARAILLITDGEDHDSFPLDAAAAAAERGIKIIAIGFGDENGSEIYVTDPRTGARVLVTDSNGQPVKSRLDGSLLRDIALATEGAYVPAGTGLLDLESIYEQHIDRLTRAQITERSRVIRDDIFQWAVLLALVFLVSSVVVSGGHASDRWSRSLLVVGMLFPLSGYSPVAEAQIIPADEPAAHTPTGDLAAESDIADTPPPPEDPREIYNAGVAALDASDFEQAEHDFRTARREATDDGKLRFHTTYNLGFTLVERASVLKESDPQQGLRLLYEAADGFREAIRLRPEDGDARHNLEVVLNRALLLSDALARQGGEDLAAQLEKLTAAQRSAAATVAVLVERVSGEDGPHISESLRPEFRAAATVQRTVLSDADDFARRAGDELEQLSDSPEEERAPEDQLRAIQLENVLYYMHRARERMGQGRQQLRRRQAPRAYRRSSSALVELKRAQDQLKDPISVLDLVLSSALEISLYTEGYARAAGALLGSNEARVPAWLTREYLFDQQESAAERTGELHVRLQVGDVSDPTTPEATRQLAAVRSAEPFVEAGHEAFTEAARELDGGSLKGAQDAQRRGIEALAEARERFLDLRGLLETLYADEKRVLAVLSSADQDVREALREFLPPLRSATLRNLDRSERLRAMIHEQESVLRTGGTQEEVDPEQIEAQLERLKAGVLLLDLARSEMEQARLSLGDRTDSGTDADFEKATLETGRAVDHLASLRRLFFSVVELVREIAERQLEVADATQDLAAVAEEEVAPEAFGPLHPRQERLSQRTEAIAVELEEQSREPDQNQDPASAEDAMERLRLAAEHLLLAQRSMGNALTSFEADPPGFELARADQETALVELARALQQLTPPDPPQQPEQGEDGEGQEQQDEGQRDPQGMDPQQLLQGVRDREAERREERESGAPSGYETVEKDW